MSIFNYIKLISITKMKNTNGTRPVNTVDIKINITLLHFQLTVIYWRNITLSIFTTFSHEWCIANTRGSLLRIYMPYNLGRICCCSKYFAQSLNMLIGCGVWGPRDSRFSDSTHSAPAQFTTWHLINEITEQVLAGKETWRAQQE